MTNVLETLAAYTVEHQLDSGGGHLRAALLAVVITQQNPGLPAAEVIDLARNDPWDERVRKASNETSRLLDAASYAALGLVDDEAEPAEVWS